MFHNMISEITRKQIPMPTYSFMENGKLRFYVESEKEFSAPDAWSNTIWNGCKCNLRGYHDQGWCILEQEVCISMWTPKEDAERMKQDREAILKLRPLRQK